MIEKIFWDENLGDFNYGGILISFMIITFSLGLILWAYNWMVEIIFLPKQRKKEKSRQSEKYNCYLERQGSVIFTQNK